MLLPAKCQALEPLAQTFLILQMEKLEVGTSLRLTPVPHKRRGWNPRFSEPEVRSTLCGKTLPRPALRPERRDPKSPPVWAYVRVCSLNAVAKCL